MRVSWWSLGLVLLSTSLAWATEYGVRLTWEYTQGQPPAVRFQIHRQTECAGPFVLVAEITPDGLPLGPMTYTYDDMTITVGTSYCWVVAAVDATGQRSTASNLAAVTCTTTAQARLVCAGTADTPAETGGTR